MGGSTYPDSTATDKGRTAVLHEQYANHHAPETANAF
jgi:hypothetical protein